MKSIFIAGTDTGVGKTVVTGLLAKFFLERGISVTTQKWIQTGSKNFPVDIATHLSIMGRSKKEVSDNIPVLLAA